MGTFDKSNLFVYTCTIIQLLIFYPEIKIYLAVPTLTAALKLLELDYRTIKHFIYL